MASRPDVTFEKHWANNCNHLSCTHVDAAPVTFGGVTRYKADEEGMLSVDVSGFVPQSGAAYIVNTVTVDGGKFALQVTYGRERYSR